MPIGPMANTTRLRNARIVLPDRIVEPGDLLIRDGRIARISETPATDSLVSETTIELTGLTLFPGFIDIHIHGAVGVDTLDADASDLARVSSFLAANGVTGWLPTLVPASTADYQRSIRAITETITQQSTQSGSGQGARILGVHYEGPFVNTAQCGALRPQFFRTFSKAEDLADLPKLSAVSAKHLMTLAPEIEGGVELVKALTKRGWIVSLGHTRASIETLDKALSAGARHMTHFMNAMAPLHHRSPGPVAWGLMHDDVTCDIIADGIHLDRHALQLLLKLKTSERLLLISDAIAAAGSGDGEYEIWGETITVTKGRTSNASGHIAGSVITMLEAAAMMASLGALETDLARMTSGNPARLLGIDHECGSIEEGKRADLVALNPQGQVAMTMIGGVVSESDE